MTCIRPEGNHEIKDGDRNEIKILSARSWNWYDRDRIDPGNQLFSPSLTDDQIRERAEQLGMVDSSELTLAALQNSVQQQAQENTEKTEASPEPETEEAMTTTSEPEATVAPENTMEPEATPQPETIVASEAAQTVTVTVKKGASSGSVSSRLQEAGLVEDAKTFDNYLCNNGYSRSINPGTYEIVPGTSEEEIAKIITGKH